MPDQTPEPLTDDDLTTPGPMAGSPDLESNERYRRLREGIASGYAEGTGCSAAVYELREVQQ